MKHPEPVRGDRETLTLEHVEKAILHLIEDGKSPNETNVRKLLGGSPNTLHPLVRQWFAERAHALLSGQITVVQSSDLPKAAHDLIAELREDARRAADEALAEAQAAVDAERKAAQEILKKVEVKESELAKKTEEAEKVIPVFKANLDLANAELAAARSSAASAAAERREAEAGRQAAEAMAKDAEKRHDQAQAALNSANDTLASLKSDLTASRLATESAKSDLAAKQAELLRVTSEAAASMTALRDSIEEIKTAHLREVQSMRATQADAASRWADAKAALEKRLLALESDLEKRIVAATESNLALRNLQHSEGLLRAEIAVLDREIEESRRRNAELEKLAARVPEGIADLAERLQRLESENASKAAKE